MVENNPLCRRIGECCARYECDDGIIAIRIADYVDNITTQIEQSDSLVEIYCSAEIDYYLFENEGYLQAVWIYQNYEGLISGPISTSDMKKMIDSIEKG